MSRKPLAPTPWWVAILLAFLGLTACFLAIAYLSWVQVGGHVYWFGVFMFALNVATVVAAAVATSMDSRTGRVSWRWWAVLGTFVVFSLLMYPYMGNFA